MSNAIQYITNEQGEKVGVVLDFLTYTKLADSSKLDEDCIYALSFDELAALESCGLISDDQTRLDDLLTKQAKTALKPEEKIELDNLLIKANQLASLKKRATNTIQRLKPKETEQVFYNIYENNAWAGRNSISGTGSDLDQTNIIIQKLPALFRNLHISTMLDIPCGDFYWMSNVDLHGIEYTGFDIVDELIARNTEQYQRDNVRFQKLNLLKDELPKSDLVFCRDCLVHFSFTDIFCALDNLCNSQSKYLLTTTFTDRVENQDIAMGQWRPLNLEKPPFQLPKPLRVVVEGCTEGNGLYQDKSLGLWKISDIRASLSNR